MTEREIALFTERLRQLGKYDDSQIRAILQFVDQMSVIVFDTLFENYGTEEKNQCEKGQDGQDLSNGQTNWSNPDQG